MHWGWLLFTTDCCAIIWVNSLGTENETGAALWSASTTHSFPALSLGLGIRGTGFQGKPQSLGDLSESWLNTHCLCTELIYHSEERVWLHFRCLTTGSIQAPFLPVPLAPYPDKLKRKPGAPSLYTVRNSNHAVPEPCARGLPPGTSHCPPQTLKPHASVFTGAIPQHLGPVLVSPESPIMWGNFSCHLGTCVASASILAPILDGRLITSPTREPWNINFILNALIWCCLG